MLYLFWVSRLFHFLSLNSLQKSIPFLRYAEAYDVDQKVHGVKWAEADWRAWERRVVVNSSSISEGVSNSSTPESKTSQTSNLTAADGERQSGGDRDLTLLTESSDEVRTNSDSTKRREILPKGDSALLSSDTEEQNVETVKASFPNLDDDLTGYRRQRAPKDLVFVCIAGKHELGGLWPEQRLFDAARFSEDYGFMIEQDKAFCREGKEVDTDDCTDVDVGSDAGSDVSAEVPRSRNSCNRRVVNSKLNSRVETRIIPEGDHWSLYSGETGLNQVLNLMDLDSK